MPYNIPCVCLGGRTSDNRWPSRSGSIPHKQFQSPSPTATTPDVMIVRPPHPPSVPVTASKRGSVASQRSLLAFCSAKTRSDATGRTTGPDSTRVLMEAPHASRSMFKSEILKDVVSVRDDLTLQAAIETVSLVKPNLDEHTSGTGLQAGKRVISELSLSSAGVVAEERTGVPLVSEVGGNADKLVSEVDELDARACSHTGIEKEFELKVSCEV